MRYNKVQQEIADYIIKRIKNNGSFFNKDLLKMELGKKYGEGAEYRYVMNIIELMKSDGLINESPQYYRLTAEGDKAVSSGVAGREKRLNFKERFNMAKDVVALISGLCGIIGFLLGLIIGRI